MSKTVTDTVTAVDFCLVFNSNNNKHIVERHKVVTSEAHYSFWCYCTLVLQENFADNHSRFFTDRVFTEKSL